MTASELTELAVRVEADRTRHTENMMKLAGAARRALEANCNRFAVFPGDMLAIAEATLFAIAAQQQDRQTEGESRNG